MTTPTYPPQLTGDQVTLLGLGVRAIVAAPVLAFASLANGQTFVTITPAGAVDSRTINAALAASTDRPTFCAALAAELNTAGTTAYNWTVNTSSPVDGLIGTAKAYGSAYNSAPTGTALTGGVGSITTMGINPYDSRFNVRRNTVTLSANVTTLTAPIANADTCGSILARFSIVAASATQNNFSLHINGATTGISSAGITGGIGAAPSLVGGASAAIGTVNASGGAVGVKATMELWCLHPEIAHEGERTFKARATYKYNSTTVAFLDYNFLWTGSGTITSIGISGSLASGIGSTSTAEILTGV